ncbi:hypothetical protein BU14_0603s0002 [Porphyra umbilicalis]|uniref:Uncharacterized protein n=1 Tax=Porphyra umbilicalis TaxID=2786 RepID=A0A1X6NR50_PORUM|nr:hypothetical protein BU14_0603s0002 [Porphyra umbilicalis]|eukprot:OSX71081.1 hypothetical protein BU14_0603s0002 [Porphyra umbilicalis]
MGLAGRRWRLHKWPAAPRKGTTRGLGAIR